MIIETLVAAWIACGLMTVIVEFMIWAQVNRQLSPDRRIGVHELRYLSTWFGRSGLLARHRSFYPQSALGSTFRVLWIFFFAVLATLIYAKANG